MNRIKTETLNVTKLLLNRKNVLTFVGLAVMTVYLPTVIHSQVITGSLVNMSLILATFLLGPSVAIVLAFLPSSFAFLSGLLPALLIPLIPFIIASNIILIKTYSYFGKKKFVNSIFVASLLKFVFLFGSGYILSTFIFQSQQVSTLVSTMFGWTQFVTAIIGGVLAFAVLALFKNHKQQS